ncbi:endonuclease III domain-containing protein [bacterium]|nr:endonuclease III domain-containing protein [bacterium]
MKIVGYQKDLRGLSLDTFLLSIYSALYDTFGPQHWWPAETRLEIVVGAILTQNTNWKNVEKAIDNLKESGILTIEGILENKDRIPELIKSVGYYRIKTDRLINLMNKIKEYGSLENFLSLPLERLREELLSIKGIGKETADSIILYASGYPIFVVDAYTRRLFSRLGIIRGNESYDEIQNMVMKNTPKDEYLYNEFHALIVELCKRYCRKKPICIGCPVGKFCEGVENEEFYNKGL